MMSAHPREERPLTGRFRADGVPVGLQEYVQEGGYAGLAKALAMTPADVRKAVLDSKLAGRGGAGFSAGRKWGFMVADLDYGETKFVVANADEMEPGAFKDRFLMDGDPHLLLEGMAITAYAVGATVAYLFIRREYAATAQTMRRAIDEATAAGYLGTKIMGSEFHVDVRLHVSAGRYICGEGSAMLNALEGERPIPRHKPPHQTSSGLWSKPTVVNNVETLCCVPGIIEHGPEWFIGLGAAEQSGTKIYTVSGRVNRPGAWELPLGTTVQELIEVHAGGMRSGLRVRGVLPGGGSTPFLLGAQLDTPMDEDSLRNAGSRLGTGTLIVLDDQTCPVGMLQNLQRFYAQESCGWCTPCWQGLHWIEQLLASIEQGRGTMGDLDLLDWHTSLIKPEHTFCDLAPGAMEPLESGLRLFRDDFVQHIRDKACSWERPGWS